MQRKHKIVVNVTFVNPVSVKEACLYVDANMAGEHDDVIKVYPAQSFDRVIASLPKK